MFRICLLQALEVFIKRNTALKNTLSKIRVYMTPEWISDITRFRSNYKWKQLSKELVSIVGLVANIQVSSRPARLQSSTAAGRKPTSCNRQSEEKAFLFIDITLHS